VDGVVPYGKAPHSYVRSAERVRLGHYFLDEAKGAKNFINQFTKVRDSPAMQSCSPVERRMLRGM